MVEESQAQELMVQLVKQRVKQHIKTLDDAEVSGDDARALCDFLQDELLPTFAMLANDVEALGQAVITHDEIIGELQESGGGGGSQLTAEDGERILDWLRANNAMLKGILDNAGAMATALGPIKQHLEEGEKLVAFIESLMMDTDEDDESDEGDGATS
jgi:hypothetical protein